MSSSPWTHAVGYAHDLVVAPGERVDLMLSIDAPLVDVDFVRLQHPDDAGVGGRGLLEQPVADWEPLTDVPGGVQVAQAGSSATVSGIVLPRDADTVHIQVWVWSLRPRYDRDQCILHLTDVADSVVVGLDAEGTPYAEVATLGRATLDQPLTPSTWTRLTLSLPRAGSPTLNQETLRPVPGGSQQATLPGDYDLDRLAARPLTLHLAALDGTSAHFSGRIDEPRLLVGPEVASAQAVVDLDLGSDPHGTGIVDRAAPGRGGTVVNMPTRGVSGHRYDGTEVDYRLAPQMYSAVHFHDDDIVDLDWSASVTTEVPADLRSGFYAARVHVDGTVVDRIPFVVRPARGEPTAPVVLLAPTVTYVAYANSRLSARVDFAALGLSTDFSPLHPLDVGLQAHPEWGASTYDVHSDGSPVYYAGWRRPISGLRPHHYLRQTGAPRHLGADLYLTHWLDRVGVDYDVVSDHDLHDDGTEALAGARVLILASHPEYWTREMLDALERFQRDGGSVMYLGGNGLYWVTSIDPADGSVVEVRRGNAGARAWECLPGELVHSTTGEVGGLWRHRGRAPQRYVGVGMTSQGWGGETPGYRLLEDADSERVAFAFDGVDRNQVFGSYGIGYGGAAGDEIDRMDIALGTPRHALQLGTSQGAHGAQYQLVPEDIQVTVPDLDGTNNDLVRADLVFYETGHGGAVFSVGSISYCTALSHDDYDNDVARLTTNVLRRMASREPFELPDR